MATLTIRNLDDGVKAKLQARAVKHGRSLSAEVRDILEQAVSVPEPTPGKGLGTRTHELFAGLGWDGRHFQFATNCRDMSIFRKTEATPSEP